ncbi:MAG: hypothetical protein KF766_08110 [Rhodocyclaceae bacterium]|nr:hypothetical protein [Rhodocyclaceae bacterium]
MAKIKETRIEMADPAGEVIMVAPVPKKREAMASVGIEHRSLGDQWIDRSPGRWG